MELIRLTFRPFAIYGNRLNFQIFQNIMWTGLKTYKNVIGKEPTSESTTVSRKNTGSRPDKWNRKDT